MITLNLFFPQWQDSGTTNELYRGAFLLKNKLFNDTVFACIEVPESEPLEKLKGILGYSSVIAQLTAANRKLNQTNPDRIFTIGGGCGVEVAPVSFLNEKYQRDLAVLWFDAHGDLNTPETSPSGTFHGMPLRLLMGDGDSVAKNLVFSKIESNQVVLLGTRDLDYPEAQFINEKTITVFKPNELNNANAVTTTIQNRKLNNVYIHLDLDVIDPEQFPYVKCPTDHGISVKKLIATIKQIKASFNVVGTSIVEYAGTKGLGTVNSILDVLSF